MRWGLSDSLPYMNYEGMHEGQVSTDEFNFADNMWVDLNPLFSKDEASNQIIKLLSEPIIKFTPDYVPVKTGLVYDWDQISESHYKFYSGNERGRNPENNCQKCG